MNIKELKEIINDLPDDMEVAVPTRYTQAYKRIVQGIVQKDWHSNLDNTVADRVLLLD